MKKNNFSFIITQGFCHIQVFWHMLTIDAYKTKLNGPGDVCQMEVLVL